ncbi:porin [Pelagibius sp. Alg239-R121]|uniref:porin n=1 Tax=Pelagibius sp. Alg239-R121 TaxID=2993448 RepID=UPI0024A781E4|nr:porin [Pelagibius sp. Alg239-R121]
MTLRIPGMIVLAGAFALLPNVAWAMDFEQLVPGGYFTESAALGAAGAHSRAEPWSPQSAPFINRLDEQPLDLRSNRQALDSQRYSISPYGADASAGIAVFTPRFAGLQGGLGYRPESLGTDEATEVGANWIVDLSPDSRITAASSYGLKSGGFDIGAGYAQGPWELQLTYGSGEGENENEEIESLALSAGYSLGPGISFTGILGAAGRTNSAEENSGADDAKNDDFWVVTGFKIRF